LQQVGYRGEGGAAAGHSEPPVQAPAAALDEGEVLDWTPEFYPAQENIEQMKLQVRINKRLPLPKVTVPVEMRRFFFDTAYSAGIKGILTKTLKVSRRPRNITYGGYYFWLLMYELVRQTDWRVVVSAVDGPNADDGHDYGDGGDDYDPEWDEDEEEEVVVEKEDVFTLIVIEKDGLNLKIKSEDDGTLFAVLMGVQLSNKAYDDLIWLMRDRGITQCAAVIEKRWYCKYLDHDTNKLVDTMDEPIHLVDESGMGAQKAIDYILDRLQHPDKKEEPEGFQGPTLGDIMADFAAATGGRETPISVTG